MQDGSHRHTLWHTRSYHIPCYTPINLFPLLAKNSFPCWQKTSFPCWQKNSFPCPQHTPWFLFHALRYLHSIICTGVYPPWWLSMFPLDSTLPYRLHRLASNAACHRLRSPTGTSHLASRHHHGPYCTPPFRASLLKSYPGQDVSGHDASWRAAGALD